VKHSLLSFHPLDQFLDPIKHSLIGYSGRHALVMLDLAINFDALITHRSVTFVRGRPNSCRLDDAEVAILFQYSKLGPLRVETGQCQKQRGEVLHCRYRPTQRQPANPGLTGELPRVMARRLTKEAPTEAALTSLPG